MLIVATALGLGAFKADDPVVVLPMLAISCAVVILFSNGITSFISFSLLCGSENLLIQLWYKGVKHSATITAFTLMPYFNSSTAHSLVKALRPPLAAA